MPSAFTFSPSLHPSCLYSLPLFLQQPLLALIYAGACPLPLYTCIFITCSMYRSSRSGDTPLPQASRILRRIGQLPHSQNTGENEKSHFGSLKRQRLHTHQQNLLPVKCRHILECRECILNEVKCRNESWRVRDAVKIEFRKLKDLFSLFSWALFSVVASCMTVEILLVATWASGCFYLLRAIKRTWPSRCKRLSHPSVFHSGASISM